MPPDPPSNLGARRLRLDGPSSLPDFLQFCSPHLCLLLVSITQNEQTDTLLSYCQSGSHIMIYIMCHFNCRQCLYGKERSQLECRFSTEQKHNKKYDVADQCGLYFQPRLLLTIYFLNLCQVSYFKTCILACCNQMLSEYGIC